MYRQYFKNTLHTDQLKEINRNSPDGVKYCNGLCQDFREKTEFSGVHIICNNCRNFMNLADGQIKSKKVTLEQLYENPGIIYGIDITIDTLKKCNICKQDKTITHFDYKKNQCKACRALQASERNNKDIDILISDIEKLKNTIDKLEKFVIDIPKDKLIKVISHFKIGRKATDTKSIMINNVVKHFQKIMNPKLCIGGCGYELVNTFDTCEKCKNKDKTANTKMAEFEENLDHIVHNFKKIEKNDEYKYTKDKLYKIAIQLGAKAKKSHKKSILVNLINKKLDDNEKHLEIDKTKTDNRYDLMLNGTTITSRIEDGFINATALCKAGGKEFKHWYSLQITKELISVLESQKIKDDTTFKSVDVKQGKYGGSWIHPDLAVQLAQWISPIFALQVSKWVREICFYGSVVTGTEKTDKELIELQKKLLLQEQKIKELKTNNKNILLKRQYHKLQKGSCFYIIKTHDNRYKVGFDGVDVNERLKTYRTLIPDIKLVCLIYSDKSYLIEQCILSRFNTKKLEFNHEVLIFIEDITLNELISSINTLIEFCNFKAYKCSEEDMEKYNTS
jgi:hypothetical protein